MLRTFSCLLILAGLTPSSRGQDNASILQRNFALCRSGLGLACDESLLTPEQAAQVRDARLRRNYEACVTGIGYGCDESLLNTEQAGEVRAAASRRNYKACLAGFGCVEDRLTPEQAAEVREAALRRNARACMAGLRFGCDESRLTPQQVSEVRAAGLRRNYTACVSVMRVGCDERLLTPEEVEQVRAASQRLAEKMAEFRISMRKQAELAWKGGFLVHTASFDCAPTPEAAIAPVIEETAQANRMNADLIRRVIERESGYYACAISEKGARGLMQLMPGTIQQFGVLDAFDARQNIAAGAKYLKQLLNRYEGDLSLALAAYNAGPGAVDAAQGIPDIQETKDYVDAIVKKLR